LSKNGKQLKKKYQKDEYYVPKHRNFIDKRPVDEWLRLRESKINSITYKKWHYDSEGKSNYCDEYETNVNDIVQMRNIFKAVNMELVITVEKDRSSWLIDDYEVSIDQVEGLGQFVEVEYKGEDANVDPKEVTKDMVKFLKAAGCKKIQRNYLGYPFMILYPKEVEFEDQ